MIVGAGLYGATFAQQMTEAGRRCLVIDRRGHIGGNAYTEQVNGVTVHRYGPHIFHTNDRQIWSYVRRFVEFNRFTNSPMAYYQGRMYSLPFNMLTFSQMWGVVTPEEAAAILLKQRREVGWEPRNLEEQAISLVGRDIYEKLVKGYTEKQWGRPCRELPCSIIKRLPVRLTYDSMVIDDLGAERQSEYAQEIVYAVVDERYKTRKPLIVTTNLTLDEMNDPKSMDYKRIYSRIQEMCVPVYFKGGSRRVKIAEGKKDVVREIFG